MNFLGTGTVSLTPAAGRVRAWTDRVLHIQQRATSRSEGAHRTIKSGLDGRGDLAQFVHPIELLVLRRHRENAAETEKQRALSATELVLASSEPTVFRPSDIDTGPYRTMGQSLHVIRKAADGYKQLVQLPRLLNQMHRSFP